MELNSTAGMLDMRPPRLEDAGLEDCALPTSGIQEAFKRAADALQTAQRHVQSTATGIMGSVGTVGEEFVKNPGPSNGLWDDSCVDPKGVPVLGEGQSCVDTKTGGLVEKGNDLVLGQGAGHTDGDKVVFGKESGPKLGDEGCVEGLAGDKGKDKDTTDESEDGPILVLG